MSNEAPRSGTSRTMIGKDYYPTISELVWSSEDDTAKILSGLSKSSISCLHRECLSQLKVALNKETSLTEVVSSLSTGMNDLNATAILKIESSVEQIFRELQATKIQEVPVTTIPVTGVKVISPIPNSIDDYRYQAKVVGIPEKVEKYPNNRALADRDAVIAVMKNLGMDYSTVKDCYRRGKYNKEKLRPLIVNFSSIWDSTLMRNKAMTAELYKKKKYLCSPNFHSKIKK